MAGQTQQPPTNERIVLLLEDVKAQLEQIVRLLDRK
jgi:hypothetical protein